MNDQELLKQYAELSLLEKQTIARRKALGEKLQLVLTKDLLKTEFGSFQLKQRSTFTYSSEVEKLEAEVKALKALEEAQGKAVLKSITQYVQYTAPKE